MTPYARLVPPPGCTCERHEGCCCVRPCSACVRASTCKGRTQGRAESARTRAPRRGGSPKQRWIVHTRGRSGLILAADSGIPCNCQKWGKAYRLRQASYASGCPADPRDLTRVTFVCDSPMHLLASRRSFRRVQRLVFIPGLKLM